MNWIVILFVVTLSLISTPALASEYGDGMSSKQVYINELEAQIKALLLKLENVKKETEESGVGAAKTLPTCSLTTDKPVYNLNDQIKLTMYSSNAKYARFIRDTQKKDFLQTPKGKVPPFGSYSIDAIVQGNQTLSVKVTGKNRKSAFCRTSVSVE